MQTIIAIETSTDTCSVALLHQGAVHQREITGAKRHAESVLVFVDALLSEAGISKRQLDGIAFGQGPGAFTGVRLAVAVAQGLSFALDIPAMGVSTLKATAWAAFMQEQSLRNKPLWAVLDARMGEVYAGRFQFRADSNTVRAISAEMVDKPEAVPFESTAEKVVGSGALIYASVFKPDSSKLFAPSAAAIVQLAHSEPKLSAADAMPVYLRDRVALTIKEREAVAAAKALAI